MEDDVIEPPRSTDELFRADDNDAELNACLNYGIEEFCYVEGFRRAGEILTNFVCENEVDQDGLLFPIVFSYRHYTELILKRLTRVGASLVDKKLSDAEQKLLVRHRIDKLWENFKPILTEVCLAADWAEPSQGDIEGVDSYIRQLTDLDPESFAFRYSTTTKGNPALPNTRHINIRNFSELLERLVNFFETIESGFSALEDMKSEMLSGH